MQKRQANRAVIARRIPAPAQVEARISVRETSVVARNVRAADIRELAVGERKARKSPRMTAAQKDSRGQRSAWNHSPYLGYRLGAIANDKRWTASN